MIVRVDLGPQSYSIVVAAHALSTVGERLRALRVGRRAALITDGTILRLHGNAVTRSLEGAGFVLTVIEVPDGETAKSLAVAERCWDGALGAGLDRTSTILGLGGGAVGDLAGFVAATYMRGMNFVTLPTTVLAQVDASIGGKTAIDHPKAKNLVGAFHQPRLVIVDPAVVVTLPDREFRSGLAEIVKHGIVLEETYFNEVAHDAHDLLGRNLGALERIIAGSCRLKASVIERDPEEKSELRFALNYGHTIGHALEATTGYTRWTHGEAVALGIAAEARLARRVGIADESTLAVQEELLSRLGLPVRADGIDVDNVLTAITHDKKARDGRVPFVLVPRLGQFRVVYDVPAAEIRGVLEELAAPERGRPLRTPLH
jgi:3-dehydroquinate synthase